jgi:hypothetical protein
MRMTNVKRGMAKRRGMSARAFWASAIRRSKRKMRLRVVNITNIRMTFCVNIISVLRTPWRNSVMGSIF